MLRWLIKKHGKEWLIVIKKKGKSETDTSRLAPSSMMKLGLRIIMAESERQSKALVKFN